MTEKKCFEDDEQKINRVHKSWWLVSSSFRQKNDSQNCPVTKPNITNNASWFCETLQNPFMEQKQPTSGLFSAGKLS